MSRAYTRLGLGLALMVVACGPKGPATTKSPNGGGAGGGGGATNEKGETTFAYRASKLRSKASVELTSTGGGVYLQATATVRATLSIETTDAGLRVNWDIDGVDGLKLDGTLPPPATDPATYLAEHGKGVWVLDAGGRARFASHDELRRIYGREVVTLRSTPAAARTWAPPMPMSATSSGASSSPPRPSG